MARFGRRIRRAVKKVKKAVTQAVEIIKDVVEFTFTGELSGTEGNDTLNAIGIAGTVKAKGGDDTVNLGAGAVTVEDTTGALQVNGAAGSVKVRKSGSGDITFRGAAGAVDIVTRGGIDYAGAAFSNQLETVSDDALLRFRGAGGSNSIKGTAATDGDGSRIDVDFVGAGAKNEISTRAAASKVSFAGGGIANSISVVADDAEVDFTGAGADNRISIGTLEGDVQKATRKIGTLLGGVASGNRMLSLGSRIGTVAATATSQAPTPSATTRAKVRFDGAGANNVIDVGANRTEIEFNGAGAHNRISATGYGADSTADISYAGAGGYTDIDVLADRARVDFAGAGIVNSIFVQSDDGAVDFDGIGAGNIVDVRAQDETGNASRAEVTFVGGGGANIIGTQAAESRITFRGAGAYNEIVAAGLGTDSFAEVDFAGGGAWNVIDVVADRGGVRFAGAGGYNEIYLETRDGSVAFDGVGAANLIDLLEKEGAGESRGDIDFTGGGGANILRSFVDHGDIRFTGGGAANHVRRIGSDLATGDVIFTGGGGANIVTSRVLQGDIVFTGGGALNKVRRWMAGDGTTGDVIFAGAGAKNEVLSWVQHGDIRFDGVGAGNDVRRVNKVEDSTGDVVFRGGGGANIVRSEVVTGDIDFAGIGAANVITRQSFHDGSQGDILFAGGGGANVITSTIRHGDIDFTGIGLANVVTRAGDALSTGDIRFLGGGGANVITHEVNDGDLHFAGAGAANVLTRLAAGTGSRGDVVFSGAGIGNAVTSLVDHGDIVFQGAGGANVVTRQGGTGSSGDVAFTGVGLGNIVTHLTDHGDTVFLGGGGGNAVTRRGATGDLDFTGAGIANVIVHDVVSGDLSVTAAGGANVVTRSGAGDTEAVLAGGANVLLAGMGRGAGTETAGAASDVDVTMLGGANVLTTDVTGTTTALLGGRANVARIHGHADVTAVGSVNVITTGAQADTIRSFGIANVITTSGDNNRIESYGAFSVIRDGGEDVAASEKAEGELTLVDVISGATGAVIDTTIDGIEGGQEDAFSDPGIYLEAIEGALDLGETAGAATGPAVADDPQAEPGDPVPSLEEAMAARGAPADPATGTEPGAELGDDWAVMAEAEVSARADPAAAAPQEAPAIDEAALTAGVDAELERHAAGLEKARRSADEVAAETEAEGARAAEEEEDAGDDSVASGTDIAQIGDVEDDENGVIGAKAGFGFEFAGANYNTAILAGLANVASFGTKDDFVIAASALNYISAGDGDDVALMLGLGNVFLGGDGNDVAVQLAAGNVALMGEGNKDVAIQAGHSNFAGKDGDGDLYAFALGTANFVYHGGMRTDQSADRTGNLVAVMGGYLNVAHKQGDGNVTGIQMGNINTLSHAGDGRYVAVMLGSVNVATKVGAGDAYFFMGGNLNVATHVNAHGAAARTVFVMAGRVNVATSVGDGLMVGIFLGTANIVTRVGNGTVGVAMLGKANVLSVVNSDNSAMYAAVGGKVNAVTKAGDGVLVALGYGGIANVVTHVGDGTTVAVQVGKLNVMTKIGNSYAGRDGKGATVMIGAGQANIVTHVGDGTTVIAADGILNVATKVGDGSTVALLNGQANVAIHVGDGMFIGVSVSKVRPGSRTAKAAKTVDSAAAVTQALTDPIPPHDGERALGILDILMTENGEAGHGREGPQMQTDRLSSLLRPGNDEAFAAMMLRFTTLAADVETGIEDAANGMPGSGRGGPDLGGASEAIGDAAQKIGNSATKSPSLSTMYNQVANQVSANIGAKFGKGDVIFTQVGLNSKSKPFAKTANGTDPGQGDAGRQLGEAAQKVGSTNALQTLLGSLDFDFAANIFFRIGDGRTVVGQRGSFNLVANYVDRIDEGSEEETAFAAGERDHGHGFDFVHAASGDSNVSVDVSEDRIFVAGSPDGGLNLDGDGALRTARGRDSLSLFNGSMNAAIKIGDGSSLRGMMGRYNLGVTVGNGSEIAVTKGSYNAVIRVGSVIEGDDDNNFRIGGESGPMDGMKLTVGQNNAVIEYGFSNDLLVNIGSVGGSPSEEAAAASYRERLGAAVNSALDFGKVQKGYLGDTGKVGGPVSFASTKRSTVIADVGRNAASALGNFGMLALFGVSGSTAVNYGSGAGQNSGQYARRTSESQITKFPKAISTGLAGIGSGMSSLAGLFTRTSQDPVLGPQRHNTALNAQIKERRAASQKLVRNAGTYQDGYEIRSAMDEIVGAYTDGFKQGGNVVQAGAGADIVVTYGSGNLVFGDNASAFLVDFSIAAFFPAHAQALSLNELIAMWVNTPHEKNADALFQSKDKFNKAATDQKHWTATQRTIEFVEWFQNFGDIGITIPYFTFGEMFNYGYNADGSIQGYGTDWNAVAGQFLNAFWIDLTLPSSILGGAVGSAGAQGINALLGNDAFAMAGNMLGGFMPDLGENTPDFFQPQDGEDTDPEAVTDTDPLAELEAFMYETDSVGDGSLGDLYFGPSGFPVIPGIPNFSALYETIVNFRDVVSVGEGGPLDNLRNITETLDILQGDGDILVAAGGGNMQFGGHGDDLMIAMGEVGHNFGGYGNDFILSIGKYGYLNGNGGDDYLLGLGAYNTVHDQQGNNTVLAVGDRNDIRLGNGNDTILVVGNKSKARAGGGYNFVMAYGAKNSIYLAGNDVVFGVGGENNYYILGGSSSRALVHNLGAASITLSPGAKAYVEALSDGDTFTGSGGEDLLVFSRDSDAGEMIGDSDAGAEELRRQAELDPETFGAAWSALQDGGVTKSHDTILMRGRNTVAFGGSAGSKDQDRYILGYGLKDGVILDAAGQKLGFGDETEDKIILGERLGLGDYSVELMEDAVMFRREGDDLLIFMPDHRVFADAAAPLNPEALLDDDPDNDTEAMNSVRVADYFNSRTSNGAQVVLSVWDEGAGAASFLAKWNGEYEAEEVRAAAAATESGRDVEAVHTWSDHEFSHYSYLTRDGIKAMIAAFEARKAALAAAGGALPADAEIWAGLWRGEYDAQAQGWKAGGRVRIGTGLEEYKIAQARGLFLAGGVGDERIEGTVLADVIEGGAGNDTLSGGAGSDTIFGGAGNDLLDGGTDPAAAPGTPELAEEADRLDYRGLGAGIRADLRTGEVTGTSGGAAFADTVSGFEELSGTDHADMLDGSDGDDRIFGNGGLDVLRGRGGSDHLDAGTGAAVVDGGAGDDTIVAGGMFAGAVPGLVVDSQIDGGAGSDWIDLSGAAQAVRIDIAAREVLSGGARIDFAGVENAIGSAHDDTLTGGAQANWLDGGDGDDLFTGDLAGDTLTGGAGMDTLDLSAAAAAVEIDLGTGRFATAGVAGGGIDGIETIIGTRFADTLAGAGGVAEVLIGGGGGNVLTGNGGDLDMVSYRDRGGAVEIDLQAGLAVTASGTDSLSGFALAEGSDQGDTLRAAATGSGLHGGAGADLLLGGAGDDILAGGTGSDTLDGGAGRDLADFGDLDRGVEVDLAAGRAVLGAEIDHLAGIEDLAGSRGDDTLTGDNLANEIFGGAGDDALTGRGGADALYGEAGDDLLFGGVGNDLLLGGEGNDTLRSGAGDDTLIGGAGDDLFVVYAGAGDNVIETPDHALEDGPGALSTMDDTSRDVLQIGEAAEEVGARDLWFSRDGDHLLLEVLGGGETVLSRHQISNWYAYDDTSAHRMDEFRIAGSSLTGAAAQQLVEAMAAWSPAEGMIEDRHAALRGDEDLQIALAAAWKPTGGLTFAA
ncbi:hypothetical protein [Mangrovicoccus algicola]|uniref:Calcium-binding protein n=1 Tax=Mangrovicoccus algicola TaxID=2771008 RepID=A0A8J6YZI0_9RHOB|nr:hypothetical protein [Mangrovicoccus algicola]MBE3638826.1 hypothetical protein [Mangrovicoccus algicola]